MVIAYVCKDSKEVQTEHFMCQMCLTTSVYNIHTYSMCVEEITAAQER